MNIFEGHAVSLHFRVQEARITCHKHPCYLLRVRWTSFGKSLLAALLDARYASSTYHTVHRLKFMQDASWADSSIMHPMALKAMLPICKL